MMGSLVHGRGSHRKQRSAKASQQREKNQVALYFKSQWVPYSSERPIPQPSGHCKPSCQALSLWSAGRSLPECQARSSL